MHFVKLFTKRIYILVKNIAEQGQQLRYIHKGLHYHYTGKVKGRDEVYLVVR